MVAESGNEVCAQSSGAHPSKSAKGGAAEFVMRTVGRPQLLLWGARARLHYEWSDLKMRVRKAVV
jgi:hypothetical protein